MPQKSNHDFKVNYPYVRVGTFVPMRINDILTKTVLFCCGVLLNNTKMTQNNIEISKEVKIIQFF